MRNKSKINYHPIFNTIAIVFLGLYTISLLFPLVWAFISSFRDKDEFFMNAFGLPSEWNFNNYKIAFTQLTIKTNNGTYNLIGLIIHSLEYTFLYATLPLLGDVIVGYGCSRYKSAAGKIIYALVIVRYVVPIVGGLSSSLVVAKAIGSFDNMLVAAIFQICPGGVAFLVVYSTFKGIDKAYSEAAIIDGAGHWTIFLRIMLPLARNIIAAYFVTGFISYWNDWQTSMVYFPSFPTLAYGLFRFQFSTANVVSYVPYQLAGCMVIMFPMLILFICAKDYLIGKISFGGLKG